MVEETIQRSETIPYSKPFEKHLIFSIDCFETLRDVLISAFAKRSLESFNLARTACSLSDRLFGTSLFQTRAAYEQRLFDIGTRIFVSLFHKFFDGY